MVEDREAVMAVEDRAEVGKAMEVAVMAEVAKAVEVVERAAEVVVRVQVHREVAEKEVDLRAVEAVHPEGCLSQRPSRAALPSAHCSGKDIECMSHERVTR